MIGGTFDRNRGCRRRNTVSKRIRHSDIDIYCVIWSSPGEKKKGSNKGVVKTNGNLDFRL